MNKYSVLAIGASAGGLKALREVLSALPVDLRASVLIVQHLDPHHKSMMAILLQRESKIKVKEADNGEKIQPGIVYVAPPNMHMLATDGRIELTMTAFVHFSRPSIDLLFESVAASYGDKSIGVILTGTGSDGSIGIKAIKERGGITIAQDEETSEQFGMPESAIKTGAIDMILPLQEIGPALIRLVMGPGDGQ
jgi:two-component system chemotaxis response regulator CheB